MQNQSMIVDRSAKKTIPNYLLTFDRALLQHLLTKQPKNGLMSE